MYLSSKANSILPSLSTTVVFSRCDTVNSVPTTLTSRELVCTVNLYRRDASAGFVFFRTSKYASPWSHTSRSLSQSSLSSSLELAFNTTSDPSGNSIWLVSPYCVSYTTGPCKKIYAGIAMASTSADTMPALRTQRTEEYLRRGSSRVGAGTGGLLTGWALLALIRSHTSWAMACASGAMLNSISCTRARASSTTCRLCGWSLSHVAQCCACCGLGLFTHCTKSLSAAKSSTE
jgi:hypothetical protein